MDPQNSVFLVVNTRPSDNTQWLVGVYAGDAELEARRRLSEDGTVLMQVRVVRKGEAGLRCS